MERHAIKGTPEIVRLCSLSKELYNRCNFIMRQAWFNKRRTPSMVGLVADVHGLDCFNNLHNTKTAKQTIRACLADWSNFRKALAAWKRDKSKFIKKPRPPHYKDKLAQVIFYRETVCKPLAREGILTPTNKCFSVQSLKNFKQVVVTPKTFGFIVEVRYEVDESKEKGEGGRVSLSPGKACFIDIGINNLCAITSGQHRPILVNGRPLKSINRWFNKHPCNRTSRKRYFRIENYFHHVSKYIVQNCLNRGIGKIVIGKNDGWKCGMKMGKKSNQNFQYIPLFKLMEKIKYKAEAAGIEVIFTEEAYTSKASFLDGDPLPAYEKGADEPVFSGRRKHRGLYVSSEKRNAGKGGYALNADVNGSLNIGRKVIPEFSLGIGDRSLAARPVGINPLKAFARSIVGGIDEGRLMLQTKKAVA